jgi:hypothetical protein
MDVGITVYVSCEALQLNKALRLREDDETVPDHHVHNTPPRGRNGSFGSSSQRSRVVATICCWEGEGVLKDESIETPMGCSGGQLFLLAG